jgi:hypothetical protein
MGRGLDNKLDFAPEQWLLMIKVMLVQEHRQYMLHLKLLWALRSKFGITSTQAKPRVCQAFEMKPNSRHPDSGGTVLANWKRRNFKGLFRRT